MVRAIIICCLFALAFSDTGLPGGKTTLDLSNPDVYSKIQLLANFAVDTYNARSNEIFYHVLLKVTQATSQIVSGTAYDLTFYVGQTTCNKNQVAQNDVNLNTCPPDTDGTYHKCQVQFWFQPWLNRWSDNLKITDYSCSVVQKSMATK